MKVFLMAVMAALAAVGCGKQDETDIKPVAAPASVVVPPAARGPSWVLVKSKDEMTDDSRLVAQISTGDGSEKNLLSVRCIGKNLEVIATFDQYLGNDSRPVKYRMDQREPQEETWPISSKGTAVFASENADFSRQLMASKRVLIEVSDYRDVTHRTMFEWDAGAEKIGEVLMACGRTIDGLDTKIPELRKTIALEIERWGPKNIEANKRALAAIAGFEGEINDQMTPEFALAVQSFDDDYTARCKAGKARGMRCDTMKILARANIEGIKLPVGPTIYDQTPKAIRKDMGSLRINE